MEIHSTDALWTITWETANTKYWQGQRAAKLNKQGDLLTLSDLFMLLLLSVSMATSQKKNTQADLGDWDKKSLEMTRITHLKLDLVLLHLTSDGLQEGVSL